MLPNAVRRAVHKLALGILLLLVGFRRFLLLLNSSFLGSSVGGQVLPRYHRQIPNPFICFIRRLDMCVVSHVSTTAYFFLCVSLRSEYMYGYISRDEKGGSGWPVDRRGHARIGSQGYQSTEDKHCKQRQCRQQLRDDQEVQARHIQSEMGRLWKHKFQRRHHVHVCRGDRLLRHVGLRKTDRYTRWRNHTRMEPQPQEMQQQSRPRPRCTT